MTELLYTHTFYEPCLHARRTIACIDGGTHFITIAEELYPGYYNVFEAMVTSFEGVPVVEAIRASEQFRWVLQFRTRIRLPLSLARKLEFVGGGPTQVGELLNDYTVQWER